MKQDCLSFLKKQELVFNFDEKELLQLADLINFTTFKAGEILLKEGERTNSLYFLAEGKVDVVKYDEQKDTQYKIVSLQKDSFFGEMSFLDNEPASASIRADSDCTVLILEKSKIESLLPIYEKLIRNIASHTVHRLRTTNQDYVKSLQAQLEESKLRNNFGQLYVITIILFSIFNVVPNYSYYSPIKYFLFSFGFMLIVLIPVVFFIRKIAEPISTYGFTLQNWKKVFLHSSLLSILLFVLFVSLKLLSSGREEPLFTWKSMGPYNRTESIVFFIYYSVHCLAQEFIARGVLQGALMRFMSNSHFLIPIFVVSLGFSISHLSHSLVISSITFVGSVIFGYIYYRQKNLIGVSLIHYVLGMSAIALGYM